jgi:hypothetical protein
MGDWGLGIEDWAQSQIHNPHFFLSKSVDFLIKIIINFIFNIGKKIIIK